MTEVPVGHPARAVLRDRAIEAWPPMARHLAQRYTGRGESIDDLVQIATIGLIEAVDKFDPSFGVDFAGYAIPTSCPRRSAPTARPSSATPSAVRTTSSR